VYDNKTALEEGVPILKLKIAFKVDVLFEKKWEFL